MDVGERAMVRVQPAAAAASSRCFRRGEHDVIEHVGPEAHLSANARTAAPPVSEGDNSFKLRPPWRREPRAVTVATNSSPPSALPSPESQETRSPAPPPPLADRRAKKPRAPCRLCRSPEAIEQFHDGHHVWPRSRAHGLYLRADDDGSGVSLQPGRASVHAAWAVHILHLNGGDILMLHSAANGRYLAATNSVTLRDLYGPLPSLSISWFAIRSGYGDDVLLAHTNELFL